MRFVYDILAVIGGLFALVALLVIVGAVMLNDAEENGENPFQ